MWEDQIISACDDQGNFQEYIPRMAGHTGKGRRHIGLTLLVHNNKGQVLLEKRKHLVFDNIWCFSADTHPYNINNKDETIEEAAARAIKDDFNIQTTFKNLGSYNYFKEDSKYCENEYCAMMLGEYNGEVKLNPDRGYDYVWMDKNEFLKEVESDPLKWAPWVPGGIEILKTSGFFD